MSKKYQRGPIGDPTVIRALTSHLARAYEEFINNFDGRVDHVDGFLAAHNFHTSVVKNLAETTGKELWYTVARDTFARRMNKPEGFDTKDGFESEETPEVYYRLRQAAEIQRAHDVLTAVILKEVDLELEDDALLRVAGDALCWVLQHSHNVSFATNLAKLEEMIAEAGYELDDHGRPIPPEER
jgi:predicted glycoside hydrolase/deacetylase ChbG (UPF0249 family)